MWITVLIIGLALAMMLGPIMLMQPNKRQRRLVYLRNLALEKGLQVKMLQMPDGAVHAGESIALYYHGWSGDKPLKTTWMLARQTFSHGLHFLEEWDWCDQRRALPEWQAVLKQTLPGLPASVLAVEARPHGVGVCWLEQTGGKSPEEAVEQVAVWLKEFLAAVPLPPGAQLK